MVYLYSSRERTFYALIYWYFFLADTCLADDGIGRPADEPSPAEKAALPALRARRVIDGVGHFMPRERPAIVSAAALDLLA